MSISSVPFRRQHFRKHTWVASIIGGLKKKIFYLGAVLHGGVIVIYNIAALKHLEMKGSRQEVNVWFTILVL